MSPSSSSPRPQAGRLRPVSLATARIALRSGRAEDAQPLFVDYFGSAEASIFLSRRPHPDVEHTRRFVERWCERGWSEGGRFAWVIADATDDAPFGIVLVIAEQHKAEIHYGVSAWASCKEYATEAVVTATNWMLSQGLQRVWTAVDVEHIASQRVLVKAGFSREGVLRRWASLPALGPDARDAISYSRTTT